jgi:hypothetical protein
MVLSEGTTEKIPSDTTGNRSRDRPTSSAATTLTQAQFVAVCISNGRLGQRFGLYFKYLGTLVVKLKGVILELRNVMIGYDYRILKLPGESKISGTN